MPYNTYSPAWVHHCHFCAELFAHIERPGGRRQLLATFRYDRKARTCAVLKPADAPHHFELLRRAVAALLFGTPASDS